MKFSFRKTEVIRDHVLTVIFVLLAFLLMVFRHEGGLQSVRKISVVTMSYLEQPLSQARIYRSALQTNEELGQQNIMLQDELNRLRSLREENQALRNMLELRQTYDHGLIPVNIVAKNLTGFNNSLTINRGSRDGVETGMAVVNNEGLIGQVIITTPGHAQVMPFLNVLFRASARVQGSRAYGIVSWSSERPGDLIMNYIPQTIHVPTGAVVETSGYSNQFPPHIPIGEVIGTRPEEGRDTQAVFIRPFVSIAQIAEAFVVEYRPEQEVRELLLQYEELFK